MTIVRLEKAGETGVTDREKVVKWLTSVSSEPLVAFNTHSDSEQRVYANYILALLKEREAVEPDTDSEGTCSCGNCGETVGYFSAGWSTPLKLYKFCPMCGGLVKWE